MHYIDYKHKPQIDWLEQTYLMMQYFVKYSIGDMSLKKENKMF